VGMGRSLSSRGLFISAACAYCFASARHLATNPTNPTGFPLPIAPTAKNGTRYSHLSFSLLLCFSPPAAAEECAFAFDQRGRGPPLAFRAEKSLDLPQDRGKSKSP